MQRSFFFRYGFFQANDAKGGKTNAANSYDRVKIAIKKQLDKAVGND